MHELLKTKLFIPRPRSNLVSRPRLTQRLNAGLDGRLTLIAAPAGFGKTTLLSEWIPQSPRCVTWLSLDEGDNDPARFWAYLIASVQQIHPDLGQSGLVLLQSPQSLPITVIITSLINDIAESPDSFCTVLDDYHFIDTQSIHEGMAYLIDNIPANYHLVLTTRVNPPLPLARLRARDQLSELRARDMRFRADECLTFLKEMMDLNLSAEEVAALETRTEGWIAGLQLAAFSMQGAEDVDGFIQAFTSSRRYIVEYLLEEVLNQRPQGTLEFLLQTSILDRLSGPLCDAVTCRSGGQAMLEKLEQANLFITPLDEEDIWYRYHHLFAEILQARLQQNSPEMPAELHLRASTWYEQNGFLDQAVNHILESGDWPQAINLIERVGLVAIKGGEFYKYKSWMDSIPTSEITHHPRLYVDFAWTTALDGDLDAAENMLTAIEPEVQDDPDLRVDWLSAKVWAARGRGEEAQAIDLALEALAQPVSGNLVSRYILLISLSLAYWHEGMITEAASAAEEALHFAESDGNWHVWALLLARIALAKATCGDLLGAEKVYLHALNKPPDAPDFAGGGLVQQNLAALYYEWNELEKALSYAKQGLEYSQITGYGEVWVNSLRQLAYIYQAMGDAEQANQSLDQAERVFHTHNLPQIFFSFLAASRFQVALYQGDLEGASNWIDQIQGGYGGSFHYPKISLEPAKLALAQGKKAWAGEYLSQTYGQASQKGVRYAQIEIRMLQALAASDEEKSLEYLSEALVLAEPEGYVRTFFDEGEPMRQLLLEYKSIYERKPVNQIDQESHRLLAYADRLLFAFPQSIPFGRTESESGLDPLTERELEVLHLIEEGLSNQEIADEMVVAISTVKSHINSLYGKLGTHRRTQAINIAREQGLLSD
jgi:LuxR family maltose regulon positive regulatory protein